jgi:type II secretory ATPase GspE/PulE/Tfp pilus assembly ATPase PilB-like protein/ActR/RegA family two-component response regulator
MSITAGQRALLRFLQRQGTMAAADTGKFEELSAADPAALPEVLEREGVITERELASLLSTTLRLRVIDLAAFPLDQQVARVLRESIATKYEVIPVGLEEGTVEVAMVNPLDQEAVKAIEFNTGRRVKAAVATRQEIRDALAHCYRLQESLDQFLQNIPDEGKVSITELVDDGGDLKQLAGESQLPPVVRLADMLLIEGIKNRASDIHVEPSGDKMKVRYRIDGMLEEGFAFPKWVQNALTGRLKVMAKLDIADRRTPQDGRVQVRHGDRVVDLRVSSLPTHHGEKITMRILDSSRAVTELDRLGFEDVELKRLREAGKKPQGMVLVTGPTGSGKTTTLYALIREIQSPSINVVTIENPIEYQLRGISQVEINEKQGLNFAGVLRSVLRQDPDVILVGEIRDAETAMIACQAAQTGHLVLSTVHTNDAAATVTRLIDLGIEPFAVASSLAAIVAQRLVRRVCQECSAPYTPTEEQIRQLALPPNVSTLRYGKGCPACRESGYVGRVGLYEVVPVTPALAKLIEGQASESAIRQQARAQGCRTLFEDATAKLLAGLTTPDEVLRVVRLSDGNRCPSCRAEVADEFSICPHCSTTLRLSCTGCSKPFTAGWVSCPYCGAPPPLARAAQPPQPAAPQPQPAAAPPPPAAEPPRQAAAPVAPATGDLQPAPRPVVARSFKALVVDDQPDIRNIVRMALERSGLGLTVITAQDGVEALALVEVERPDIVLLDISMPGMDGFEVCSRIRADLRTAFLPVLMLTAHDAPEFVAKGFSAGTDDYVVKPFRRDDLVARVRRMLERTYGRGEAAASPDAAPAA